MMSLSCVSTIIVVRRSPVANRRYTMVIIHAYIMARGHCNQATQTHESSQNVSRARSALGVRAPCPRVGGGAVGAAASLRGLAERKSRGTSFHWGTSFQRGGEEKRITLEPSWNTFRQSLIFEKMDSKQTSLEQPLFFL